jgi:hypothetical protein
VEDNPPARTGHPQELGEGLAGPAIIEILEHVQAQREIEAAIREGKAGRTGLDEPIGSTRRKTLQHADR